MKAGLIIGKPVLFVGAVIGGMLLSYLIDNNLEFGWPTNVVRNWQEYGLLNLHGQLAFNPGGFQVLDHPQIYHGMSPIFLYLVYFAAILFGWTGLGALAFQALLALVVVWAIWKLAGEDHFATITAIVTVLCPGYLRCQRYFDPATFSVLPILPYAVIVLAILRRPKLTPGLAVILFALTVAMVSLNWTSAWACAPFVLWILAMPGINRRGMIYLLGIMMVVIPVLALVSVAAKYGSSGAGTGTVLGNYTWGHFGYGADLTTGRAFLRIGFTNVIGLFPLWLVLAYAIGRRVRNRGGFSLPMFGPLAMAVADLISMRNYFGHHPWMAGPVLIVGIIFSLVLLRVPRAEADEKIPFKLMPAWAVGCFVYGLVVLLFFRANETQLLDLIQLVRCNTARSDTIVLRKSDLNTAALADRLPELLDRRLIVVDGLQQLAAEKDHWVILSSVELNGPLTPFAQSTIQSGSWLGKVTGWFNKSVAKRRAGDRLELSETYLLYEAGPADTH
jgi:hypothetical protein